MRGLFLPRIARMSRAGMVEGLAIDILRVRRHVLLNWRRKGGIARVGHQDRLFQFIRTLAPPASPSIDQDQNPSRIMASFRSGWRRVALH